uniref:Uncharacterized protein n=1 Tax=Oryza sativa subsp. japonica TaxID=39947 RepID=Q5Z7S6_ORYSJ|nr:hypothetical protein [Oryza sativa Japonica Group]BAD61780.1 hypothetical protein [Oryza sativa Japonica Group]
MPARRRRPSPPRWMATAARSGRVGAGCRRPSPPCPLAAVASPRPPGHRLTAPAMVAAAPALRRLAPSPPSRESRERRAAAAPVSSSSSSSPSSGEGRERDAAAGSGRRRADPGAGHLAPRHPRRSLHPPPPCPAPGP